MLSTGFRRPSGRNSSISAWPKFEDYDVGKGMQKHLSPRGFSRRFITGITFPAHREEIVQYRYSRASARVPGPSFGNLEGERIADTAGNICVEGQLLAAVNQARQAAQMEHGAPFTEERIVYILSTGANWAARSAISSLVVDEGAPNYVVSFCAEGVKKIGPTRFEVRRRISCRSATYRS